MKMKKTNWTLACKSTRISGGQPDIQLELFYFGLKWGTVFDGTTGVYERIHRFNSK